MGEFTTNAKHALTSFSGWLASRSTTMTTTVTTTEVVMTMVHDESESDGDDKTSRTVTTSW